MKIIKTASGKNKIKISKSEWQSIGKKAGWMRVAFEPSLTWEQMQDKIEKKKERMSAPGGNCQSKLCKNPEMEHPELNSVGNGLLMMNICDDCLLKILEEHKGARMGAIHSRPASDVSM